MRKHTNGRTRETEFCRLEFSINQTQRGGGESSGGKTSIQKSPTLYVRGVYNPILHANCIYPPAPATNPDASVTISHCAACALRVSAREDFPDFPNEPGGGGNGFGGKNSPPADIILFDDVIPAKRFCHTHPLRRAPHIRLHHFSVYSPCSDVRRVLIIHIYKRKYIVCDPVTGITLLYNISDRGWVGGGGGGERENKKKDDSSVLSVSGRGGKKKWAPVKRATNRTRF